MLYTWDPLVSVYDNKGTLVAVYEYNRTPRIQIHFQTMRRVRNILRNIGCICGA